MPADRIESSSYSDGTIENVGIFHQNILLRVINYQSGSMLTGSMMDDVETMHMTTLSASYDTAISSSLARRNMTLSQAVSQFGKMG